MIENRKVMYKRQLIAEVARRSGPWGLTRSQVREALHGILDVIAEQMEAGGAVTLAGFGRFQAKEHKGRRVVGRDGRVYEVESRLVPSFKAYPSLRLRVQGKAPEPEPRDPAWPPWWP